MRRDERGVTILEVMAALGVFALVAVGLATTTHTSLDLVGASNQRQTATQVANTWIEDARSTPYDAIGMTDGESYETADPASPDAAVDPNTLRYTGEDGTEDLVVLPAGVTGLVHHEHVTVNGTDLALYRYVTWVADGADTQALKRVSVVVQFAAPDIHGERRVTQSTLVSPNTVAWDSGPAPTSPPQPATTSTTGATTTTTAVSQCGDDDDGPTGSIAILAGTGANTGYTSSSTVTLSLAATDACTPITMSFSNDGTTWSDPVAYNTSWNWTLASGNGDRTVRVRFRDHAGNTSDTYSASIRVDGTPPATPGGFAATVLKSPWRVKLTWNASSDNDRLIGYRVYMAQGSSTTFQNLPPGVLAPCSTSPCAFTDNAVQNNKTYSYYVVAYDAAGNESAPTPVQIVKV